ncbi:MAG: NAD(P)-binding protein, partial [Leptolyngbyaceae cyanobacterium CRU_2_3]|nr:NAD(P)-binding protein [Leptolyngbyaceae cyanobacterium CRU_2_3]
GLVCGQRLRQLGYRVVVVEKSRGVGGRMATRRLPETWADHGVRCLENQGKFSQAIAQILTERQILHLWTETLYEIKAKANPVKAHQAGTTGEIGAATDCQPRYVSTHGLTAIAKFLSTGLEIWRSQRVRAIIPTPGQTWTVALESAAEETRMAPAKAIVLAIPAPQALMLLEPLAALLPPMLLSAVRSVEFEACITAIATYTPTHFPQITEIPWQAIACSGIADLAWISLETSKHPDSAQPVIVAQSSAEFADRHLESTDLHPVGHHLLTSAAQLLPWLAQPELLQVHRWRYAFVSRPLSKFYLSTAQPLPLVCAGDWCGGNTVEHALQSGWTAAAETAAQIQPEGIPDTSEVDFLGLLRSL